MERESNQVLSFLDVLLNNKSPQFSVTTVYRKKIFTGLLTIFLSFTPLCYKMGLVKTLIDRTFKINNTWLGFHNDIQNLFNILRKNLRLRKAPYAHKFSCARCNACYVGETSRHFSTRVHEHLSSDRTSHVYKHLQASESCRTSCNLDCFKILDSAPTKYQVKLKESMYIKWDQVKHINLTLSL